MHARARTLRSLRTRARDDYTHTRTFVLCSERRWTQRAAGDRWCSSRVISNRGGERSLPLHSPSSPLTLHRPSFFLCLVTFDSPTFALDREKETRHSKKVSTYIAAPFVWEREWRRREEPVIPVTQPRDSMKSNLHCAPPLSAAHTSHLILIRVRLSRWCSRESRQFPLISLSRHLLRGNYLSFWLWVVWTFGKLFMVYPWCSSTKMLLYCRVYRDSN